MRASNGTHVKRNGGHFAFGASERECDAQLYGSPPLHGAIFLYGPQREALRELFEKDEGA